MSRHRAQERELPRLREDDLSVAVLPALIIRVFLPAILKLWSIVPLFVTLNVVTPFTIVFFERMKWNSLGLPAVTVDRRHRRRVGAAEGRDRGNKRDGGGQDRNTTTPSEPCSRNPPRRSEDRLTILRPTIDEPSNGEGRARQRSIATLTSMTLDRLGRPLRDLRISVTDRCNFRCVYCMPKEVFGSDYRFLDRKELLTFEEIERVARVFVGLGVNKLRLTGGEPLVRKDVDRLIALLAPLGAELTLTTNASLLAPKAEALAAAGLDRVTVSLDSLDDETFRAMNDVDFPVQRVLDGIDAAAAAGMPVKVNAVIKRGLNEHSILEMAAHFRGTGHTLRFIEYMDVGTTNGWRLDDVVPAAEIVERISAEFPLEPVDPGYRGEVAKRWRYADGGGEVGLISSVTQPFCGDCTRSRISAEGRLYTCLFGIRGHDLRALVRRGASDEELATRSPGSGASAPTATPNGAPRQPSRCRKWR